MNGTDLTKKVEQTNSSYQSAAFWILKDPPTGTQTFAWDASDTSAFAEGCIFFLLCLKDVDTSGDPIRDYKMAVGNDPTTASITTSTNDTLYCIGSFYNAGGDAGYGSGQSEIADSTTVYNTDYGAVGTKAGVAGTTTMQVDGPDAYTAIIGFSVIGTNGGESPVVPPIIMTTNKFFGS